MNRRNILQIALKMIFVVIFNISFFVISGIHHPVSVWIAYGFIHFSYVTFLFAPKLLGEKSKLFELGLSNDTISLGEYEKAFDDLCTSIRLSPPEHYLPMTNMGYLIEKGFADYRVSKLFYIALKKIGDVNAFVALANQIFKVEQDLDSAMKIANEVLQISPDNILMIFLKAMIYFEKHELITACDLCDKCIELENTYWPAYFLKIYMQDENLYKNLEELANENKMEIYKISAATGQGIKELLTRVSEILKQLPKEELIKKEERKIYTLEEKDDGYTITKEKDMWVVDGPAVQRIMRRVNLEDNESMHYFQKCLDSLGVNQKLKEAGVQEGDTVRVVDWELEWYD